MAILQECPICHKKHKATKNKCSCGENLQTARKSERVKYHVTYRLPSGKQRRELVGTSLSDAYAADGKKKGLKRENKLFDVLPDSKMPFKELSEWFLGLEKVKSLACYRRRCGTLKSFNAVFGETIVSRIKPADLESYQVRRKKDGMADATVDQEIADAKTVVIKAFNNDLVGGDTLKAFRNVGKLLKGNANARDRILSPEEFDRLINNASQHLRPILAMGYYSGMRLGEILPLTWDKLDLKDRVIRLDAKDTKDKEPRAIPICDPLLEELKAIPRGIHGPVFKYGGKDMEGIYSSVKTACKRAGILYGRFKKGGFTFHDLRHTFNTNMRKSGVAESVIMDITGHSTRTMFDRYNTVDEMDRRQAIGQFKAFLENVDQVLTKAESMA